MKKRLVVTLLILVWATFAMAQQDTLQEVSSQYPIKAHVIAVEMQTGTTTTGSGGYHYNKTLCPSCTDLPDTRSTASYTWHLMKAVIGDKMYGLSSPAGRHNTWLDIGYYAFKRVKNGFEVQYRDEKGKVRQEVLTIQSEEVAPDASEGKQ